MSQDMAVLSLYYPAWAKHEISQKLSCFPSYLGEFDGCVWRILNQRLPVILPWGVMLDWGGGCSYKLFSAACQSGGCSRILPGGWTRPCRTRWKTITMGIRGRKSFGQPFLHYFRTQGPSAALFRRELSIWWIGSQRSRYSWQVWSGIYIFRAAWSHNCIIHRPQQTLCQRCGFSKWRVPIP